MTSSSTDNTKSPQFAVPVISFVGKSDSGKTTLLERVIPVLTERGISVATVKHHAHELDVDIEGKDSWRHARAGANVTMVSSPTQYSLIKRVREKTTLEQLAEEARRAGVDILLSEGYKTGPALKIEVSRLERSHEAVCEPDEIIGLVTNNPELARRLEAEGVTTFDLDDPTSVADYIYDLFFGESA